MQARALPPPGSGPVSPDTLPLPWDAAFAPSGLPQDSRQPDQPAWPLLLRMKEKSLGLLGTLGAAGAMLLDNTGIFSLGMHVVGAPFQKRDNAVAVLTPLC